MSYYERNMSVIKDKDEKLYFAVKNLKNGKKNEYDKNSYKFSVEYAKNGNPIFSALKEEKVHYLNSRYNPEREAEQFAKKYQNISDYSFICIFGLGNGQHANAMVESLPEHVTFLFYEPSIQLFLLALEYCDLSNLFSSYRVTIIVRAMNESNMNVQMSRLIDVRNYKITEFDSLPLYKQLFPEEHKLLKDIYNFQVASKGANVATYAKFGKTLAYNNIYNMRNVMYCNCEQELEGLFPVDRPAIVIAAGPSLEKNVDLLKETKNYFLMIAVDTAMPFLVDNEIEPDMVLVVDAEKPIKLFKDERTRRVPIAISADANYEIAELTDQKVIYVSAETAYYNSLFQLVGKTMYSLPGGGSVSTYAFALATSIGYKDIILVGQDLAYAPDRKHAGNIDLGQSLIDDNRIAVEGYYGGEVYSPRDYNYYREWFEKVIAGDPELNVINATEGGARIKGAVQMSLKEAIDKYKKDRFEFGKVICDLKPAFSENNRIDILNMWNKSVDNLISLKNWLQKGTDLAKEAIELIGSKRYDQTKISLIHNELCTIIEKSDALDEIVFLDQMAAGEDADILGDIYFEKENPEEELCRIFEKMMNYMSSMYLAADEVVAMFKKIIKDVNEKYHIS